jgi:hypothetical protein
MYRPSVRIYILNNAVNQTNKLDHMHAALWWLHKFDIVIRSLFCRNKSDQILYPVMTFLYPISW